MYSSNGKIEKDEYCSKIICQKNWQVDNYKPCPGQVVQLVGASSPYAKGAGLIPGHGTYKNQPIST